MKRRNFNTDKSSTLLSGANTLSSLSHSDKYGILSNISKKLQISGQDNSDQQKSVEEIFKAAVKPSIQVDSFEQLSEDFYLKELNINSS